jgi:hypothetical protein
MQIIPAVGNEISAEMSWPENYIAQDLTRPFVNVKMGAHYLAKWTNYFGGDLTAAWLPTMAALGMQWPGENSPAVIPTFSRGHSLRRDPRLHPLYH